jgi:hypothetical protein
MKRIGIGVLLIALNMADFAFRQPLHPDHNEVVLNFLLGALYATFCFSLLLHFVNTRRVWWFYIDAIVLAFLTVGMGDIVSLTKDKYDNLSVIVAFSIFTLLPIELAVNLIALTLVITFKSLMHLWRKYSNEKKIGSPYN